MHPQWHCGSECKPVTVMSIVDSTVSRECVGCSVFVSKNVMYYVWSEFRSGRPMGDRLTKAASLLRAILQRVRL